MTDASNTVINTSIRGVFLAPVTGWEAIQPTVDLFFRGEGFDPPDNATHVVVTIMGNNSEEVEFGSGRNRWRRFGIVRVQFWLVAGKGSGLAWTLADSVKTILEGRTLTGGVRLHGTSPPIEERAEGAWDRWRVDTDFDADELRLKV